VAVLRTVNPVHPGISEAIDELAATA
jgi:hypothetical protein